MKRDCYLLKKCFTSLVVTVVLCSCYLSSVKSVVYADYNQGIVTFVTSLYSDCLGRTPDSAGLDDWCAKLASGQISGKQAAYGFFFSSEFQSKANSMTDDELIDAYYKVFLNRAADSSGKSYWSSQIAGTTNDISILFTGFADSTEFSNKCDSYGITVGTFVDVPTTIRVIETNTINNGSIALNEESFPDPVFRLYISENCDNDGNGILSAEEMNQVWSIYIDDLGISDLTGIGFFKNLRVLSCSSNQLVDVDLSNNPGLIHLWIQWNSIRRLNIANNPNLIRAYQSGYTDYVQYFGEAAHLPTPINYVYWSDESTGGITYYLSCDRNVSVVTR